MNPVPAPSQSAINQSTTQTRSGAVYLRGLVVRALSPFGLLLVFTMLLSACGEKSVPVTAATIPQDGATGVAVDSTIILTFSEWMDPDATLGAFSMTPDVNGAFHWRNSSELRFTPARRLEYDTEYTGTLLARATDRSGNPIGTDIKFSFRTEPDPDDIAPSWQLLFPRKGLDLSQATPKCRWNSPSR